MKLENNLDYINDSLIAKRIIEKYKNHLSIKAIQDTFPEISFQFKLKRNLKLKKQRYSKLIRF